MDTSICNRKPHPNKIALKLRWPGFLHFAFSVPEILGDRLICCFWVSSYPVILWDFLRICHWIPGSLWWTAQVQTSMGFPPTPSDPWLGWMQCCDEVISTGVILCLRRPSAWISQFSRSQHGVTGGSCAFPWVSFIKRNGIMKFGSHFGLENQTWCECMVNFAFEGFPCSKLVWIWSYTMTPEMGVDMKDLIRHV